MIKNESLKIKGGGIEFDLVKKHMNEKELEKFVIDTIDDNFKAVKIIRDKIKRRKEND